MQSALEIFPQAPAAAVGSAVKLTANLVYPDGRQVDVSAQTTWYVVSQNSVKVVASNFSCAAAGDFLLSATYAPLTQQTHVTCQPAASAAPVAVPVAPPATPVSIPTTPAPVAPVATPTTPVATPTTPVASPTAPASLPSAIAFVDTPAYVRSEAPHRFTLMQPGTDASTTYAATSWTTDSSLASVATDGTVHCNYSGPVTLTAQLGAMRASTSFTCVVKSIAVPRGFSEHEERFDGPFAGWVSLQTFGAKGDGVADDTAALQAALNAMVNKPVVLWIPHGTYRLTQPVTALNMKNVQIVGEDPATTVFQWAGGDHSNAAIFQCQSCLNTTIKRFTIDGAGSKGSLISFDGQGSYYSTNNTMQDLRLRNADYGIRMFFSAEMSIKRIEFRSFTSAGLSIEDWNAQNIHVVDSLFVDCNYAVTNRYGEGAFYVSNSVFVRSKTADMAIANAGVYAARNNLSFGSQAFFVSYPSRAASQISLQNNEVVQPLGNALEISNPGTTTLIDNTFVGIPDGSAVLLSQGSYPLEVLAIGNNSPLAKPYQGTIARITSYAESPVPTAASLSTPPDAVYTPPQSGRVVYEVPASSTEAVVQAALDTASANGGVVHIASGGVSVSTGLTLSGNADVALVGDGPYSALLGASSLRAPVLTITGSHVQVSNMSINGFANDGIQITVPDAPGDSVLCDQCSTSYPLYGLTMERLDNATVETRSGILDCGLYNAGSFGSVSLGGTRLAAGKPGLARLNNLLTSIDYLWVGTGGHMVASDGFHDAHEGPNHLLSTDNGSFTEQGYSMNTYSAHGMTLTNASSDVTIIGDQLDNAMQADAVSTAHVMLAGSMQTQGVDAISLPGTGVTSMHIGSQTNVNNGLSTLQADDTVAAQTVERAFADARTSYDAPKRPFIAGATRVRFDKVRSDFALRGFRVLPADNRADYETFAIRGTGATSASCPAVFGDEKGWTLVDGHDGSYGIQGPKGFLGESDTVTTQGNHSLELTQAITSAEQRWAVLPYGDGSLMLVNRASGRLLTTDQTDCYTAPESPTAQGQTWSFTK